MFGISYDTWREICNMYFSLNPRSCKSYLQWFPFTRISDEDKKLIVSRKFYDSYIETGGVIFFPEVMRYTENFILKNDGSFRNSALVSPLLYLVLQSIGKEISICYTESRPVGSMAFYAGNYEQSRAKYKIDYDNFYKAINVAKEKHQFFIKTDITSFFGNINLNDLIARINSVCNQNQQRISQTRLLLYKELLSYCGNGYFPLIENSLASSYLATIIYLDDIDCELHEYIRTKAIEISNFEMIRYVDDLYIMITPKDINKKREELTATYTDIKNQYSSILKKHGLALNTKKCAFRECSEISEELKKSLYDEYVYGNQHNLGELFSGALKRFLTELYQNVCQHSITSEEYESLIEKHFSSKDIELTPSLVYNYFVYENQEELKKSDVSKILFDIIGKDISFLAIDAKRLSIMVMQCNNDNAVKKMLNQLFQRNRSGEWNSYDTMVGIAYLIQSEFRHIDLLEVLHQHNSDLWYYYRYCCKTSFLEQVKSADWNRILRCVKNDDKAVFLYFMSVCEHNRNNYLGAYAYFKNFFDRISADMAFLSGRDKGKEPNYKNYYKEIQFKTLYAGINESNAIIKQAHILRNENPLSHSSAALIENNNSSADLSKIEEKLMDLVDTFSKDNRL